MATAATSPPRISAPRIAPVCWGAKADELLDDTPAVAALPEAPVVAAAVPPLLLAPLDAAEPVVTADPVPDAVGVVVAAAPVPVADAPVVQLTAVGTLTPWAEQICWA